MVMGVIGAVLFAGFIGVVCGLAFLPAESK
jgi:hypothetical protein